MPTPTSKPYPRLYRYKTALGRNGVSIILEEFIALFESPHQYWSVPAETPTWAVDNIIKGFNRTGKVINRTCFGGKVRRTHKVADRSFCNPDLAKAWHSFIMRQSHRLDRLRTQQAQAEKAMAFAEKNQHPPLTSAGSVSLGHNSFTKGLSWNEY